MTNKNGLSAIETYYFFQFLSVLPLSKLTHIKKLISFKLIQINCNRKNCLQIGRVFFMATDANANSLATIFLAFISGIKIPANSNF